MLKKSVFFYAVVFSIITFSLILVFNPELYDWLSLEDHLIENLTALALLATSITFFLTARKSINLKLAFKVLFVFLGLVFLWGAGEEISWGQRIFGFDTPEGLKAINDQDELNIHNINKKFFDRMVDRLTILLVFASVLLKFFRVHNVFTIPLPSYFLLLAFGLTPFYHQYNHLIFDFYHTLYLPFLLILIVSLKDRKYNLMTATFITLVLTLVIRMLHLAYGDHFPVHNNSANEFREFLFAACCFAYAFQIHKHYKKSIS